MIIYNVTVNIENDVHDEWLKWMKEEHIPEVVQKGKFLEGKIMKILTADDSEGTSYAIQYTAATMGDYEKYRDEFAPALQQEALKRYKDKFVAFRTLLQLV